MGKKKLPVGTLGRRLVGTPSSRESARKKIAKLTARECEVLAFVAQGFMSTEIAATLGCAHRTVDAHRRSILAKLDVNTAAAVRLAMLAAVDEAQSLSSAPVDEE
jgi:DNA-binding NarL/FixJ family response regulator